MLRATFRSLLARKLRLLLSGFAIVLGVAMVSGALTLTDTLGRVFDELFTSVNAKTAVEVRGAQPFQTRQQGPEMQRTPVDRALLTTLSGVEGVAAVVGDVSDTAAVLTKDGKAYDNGPAPDFGANFDADPLTSPFTLRSGRAPTAADEVALDVRTSTETGYGVGATFPVLTRDGRLDVTVTGVFGFGDNDNLAGASYVAFEQRRAEELFSVDGEYDVVRIAADPGVDPVVLRDRVRAALPDGVEAVTGEESAEEAAGAVQDALGFFTTFLLVFAAVALFVGGFLIYNTFTILIAQRQRELALMRALGASRRQVVVSVLVEAVVVGVVASVVGLGAGVLIAIGLQAALRAFGGALPEGPLVVETSTVVTCFVVGVVITAVSALVPARRASGIPPVAAMRDAVTAEPSLRRGSVIGGVLLVTGAVAIGFGLQGELELLGLGALLAFLGVAALSPLVARPAARLIGAPLARAVPGRLGRLNAMRNPRRTATTAAALMVGLALVGAVSILGASAKASAEKIVRSAISADLVVQSPNGFDPISPAVAAAVRELPSVAAVDVLRFEPAQVDDSVEFVTAAPDAAIGRTLLLDRVEGVLSLGQGVLLIGEGEAASRDLAVGDEVSVTFGRGAERTLRVGGIYADNQLLGPVLLDASVFPDLTVQQDGVVLVVGREGVADSALALEVDEALEEFPIVEASSPAAFAADVTAQIDVVITIINVLLLLSILIAVLGIVNTLALAVLERTRELGLLRAVGLAQRQTRRMVRVEAVIVAVFGALLGVTVGIVLGVSLQQALSDDGITELRIPVVNLVVFVLLAGVAGVVAAILPARRAARLDVLQAIATT